jgi:hypothetical protein
MLETARDLAHVLPDLIKPGLKIVFCGPAAGNVSVARGAYYALHARTAASGPCK